LTQPPRFGRIQPEVAKINITNAARDNRRLLVKQVAGSPYLSRSSRLRDMFVYLCTRVLDDSADEIHEQEVGQEVFGRPADYDTAADNTVRVHASMLRKRVTQYFDNEGSSETLVIEIPRGNYAPVFRERVIKLPEPEPLPALPPELPPIVPVAKPGVTRWLPGALAALFAITSVVLLVLLLHAKGAAKATGLPKPGPAAGSLWSQIFPKGKATALVLSDASLGIVQERLDHPITLTEYFDRSYLSESDGRTASSRLDPAFTKGLLLKKQVNYGDVALLGRITDMARSVDGDAKVHFARDYSFRELKADNSVLFGNTGSNPWIEPFQNRLTLRWKYDADKGFYYPVDTTASASDQEKFHATMLADGPHEGYATVALLPNLNGTGNVLILSATGGSAMNTLLDFLFDENSMKQLRTQLAPNAQPTVPMPSFEALIVFNSRTNLPRSTSLVTARKIGH
jgi:hypothetical protein